MVHICGQVTVTRLMIAKHLLYSFLLMHNKLPPKFSSLKHLLLHRFWGVALMDGSSSVFHKFADKSLAGLRTWSIDWNWRITSKLAHTAVGRGILLLTKWASPHRRLPPTGWVISISCFLLPKLRSYAPSILPCPIGRSTPVGWGSGGDHRRHRHLLSICYVVVTLPVPVLGKHFPCIISLHAVNNLPSRSYHHHSTLHLKQVTLRNVTRIVA